MRMDKLVSWSVTIKMIGTYKVVDFTTHQSMHHYPILHTISCTHHVVLVCGLLISKPNVNHVILDSSSSVKVFIHAYHVPMEHTQLNTDQVTALVAHYIPHHS